MIKISSLTESALKFSQKLFAILLTLSLLALLMPEFMFNWPGINQLGPKKAKATYQYSPNGGSLTVGTEAAVSATNTGSYRGTLASDNIYWNTNSTTGGGGGLDKRINIDGVQLNGANNLMITYEGYVSNASLAYQVQIYDNVAATWRNLNDREVALANTADTTYTFEIYDGYWQSSGTPTSTPLSNFITTDANKRVQLRIYSTYTTTSYIHYLDRFQLESAVSTTFTPANLIKTAGGTVTNNYAFTYASDNNRVTVANTNTGGNQLDYYYSFKDIQTYTGANAILVNYEGLVSNAALTYKLKIYNFTTSSWEDLNATALANTTETAYQFAKSNVTLSNYISSGEVRVGIYTTTLNTYTQSTDRIYLAVGSVNTDTAKSEVSFGSVAGGTTSANTQDLDTTLATPVTWQQATAATATAPYASDWAGTYGTNYSASSNLSMPVTVPSGAAVTGVRYAARFRSNVTTNTVQLGIKDYSGQFAGPTIAGGWTAVGTTNALTTYTYTDGILQVNPEDYVDITNNLVNLRFRTSTSTATATATRDIDFAFVSIRWIGGSTPPSGSLALSNVNTTWTGVSPLSPPNNTGKGLDANVTASGGNWRLSVYTSSGDASGKLYSTDEGPSVYQGTFQWNVNSGASTPGPTYTTSLTDFLTSEQNVANNGPPGTYLVRVDYTLGNPTWDTNAAPTTGYSATHYYTLYYGL